KKDYTASTRNMCINNYQIHAAKYQHKLWSQVSASLQTPTPENIKLAMQLAENRINAAKIQLQAAYDGIDNNAKAVASAVSARQCLQMKTSSLTPNTYSKPLELLFQGDFLFSTGLKYSLTQMKVAKQTIRSCSTTGRDPPRQREVF
ncbi:UNVERIFIED_CONTAM: hypothetical protein FKN15_064567, partial [Acipenser sinensis]